MKYFTFEWWKRKCENAESVFEEYRLYYSSVRNQLPQSLVELEENHTLHDSRVSLVSSDFSNQVVQIKLRGWDISFQHAVHYSLKFSGVTQFEQVLPQDDDIDWGADDLGYWEYELIDSDVEVRMLFASGAEFRIRFNSFEFSHVPMR